MTPRARKLTVLTATVALFTVAAGVQRAHAATAAQRCGAHRQHTLSIRTVPALPLVRFTLDGTTFISQRNGRATIPFVGCGTHELVVGRPTGLRAGLEATFARWGDDIFVPQRTIRLTRDTGLDVGFDVRYLVRESFADSSGRPIDNERIQWVAQSNSIGSVERFRPGSARWLLGSRVTRRANGLAAVNVLYSVRSVVINGTNAVRQAEQRFYPATTKSFVIRLLLHTATISARDRLFGFAVGSGFKLTYPDGHTEEFRFGHGSRTTLTLPRGSYKVTVHASGLSSTIPIALTRNQKVDLNIVSYLDLAIVVEILLIGVAALFVIRSIRAHRERMRELARGLDEPVPPPNPIRTPWSEGSAT